MGFVSSLLTWICLKRRCKKKRQMFKRKRNNFLQQALLWDDRKFKQNFWSCKKSFHKLVSLLTPLIQRDFKQRGNPITISEICAISLWRLATGNAYRVIDNIFGVGVTTAWRAVNTFCQVVVDNLSPQYIRWPNSNMEWIEVIKLL